MKKVILATVSFFAFFALTVLTGCKDDPCKNITCAYSGVCKDGGCACQIGYEGVHCETVVRDKFLGIYNVNEDGTLTQTAQYPLTIIAGDNINEVKIKNMQNTLPNNYVVGVCKSDTITIASQTVNGLTVEGYGWIVATNSLDEHYYQHANITMMYKVTNSIGQVNSYAFPDGLPSLWAK